MDLKYFLVACVVLLASSVNAQKKSVCYWYPEIPGRVDPFICTHIIYSFLGVTRYGELTYSDRTEAQARAFIDYMHTLKIQNPHLKLEIAIGGYNEAMQVEWEIMAENYDYRVNFGRNVLAFLQQNNLDGVDIDWEWPNFHETRPQDKQLFNYVLQAVRDAIGYSYSLTTAISPGAWRTNLSYDIPFIFNVCDFVNLMAYDLHGGWESFTGIHAALFRGPNDNTPANVDESVQLLLGYGVPREKIIMGIPAYGIGFTLANPNNNGVGAPTTSGGYGTVYRTLCQRINSGAWNDRWEEAQRVPYMFLGSDWIGYDNVRSVTEKAYYINQQNLGGAMFWHLDGDDYDNVCGFGYHPIIRTVYNIIM